MTLSCKIIIFKPTLQTTNKLVFVHKEYMSFDSHKNIVRHVHESTTETSSSHHRLLWRKQIILQSQLSWDIDPLISDYNIYIQTWPVIIQGIDINQEKNYSFERQIRKSNLSKMKIEFDLK